MCAEHLNTASFSCFCPLNPSSDIPNWKCLVDPGKLGLAAGLAWINPDSRRVEMMKVKERIEHSCFKERAKWEGIAYDARWEDKAFRKRLLFSLQRQVLDPLLHHYRIGPVQGSCANGWLRADIKHGSAELYRWELSQTGQPVAHPTSAWEGWRISAHLQRGLFPWILLPLTPLNLCSR